MNLIKIVLLSLLLVAIDARAQPAQTIPAFTFFKLNGQQFTDKNLITGKKSVIIFFDTTCHLCQKEITAIGNRFSEFKNTMFYLVSIEEAPQINKFMASYGKKISNKSNVMVLRDYYKQFIPKFMPERYPALFIYGPDKRLIRHFGGPQNINTIIAAANR